MRSFVRFWSARARSYTTSWSDAAQSSVPSLARAPLWATENALLRTRLPAAKCRHRVRCVGRRTPRRDEQRAECEVEQPEKQHRARKPVLCKEDDGWHAEGQFLEHRREHERAVSLGIAAD